MNTMEIAANTDRRVKALATASFEDRFENIRPRLTAVCTTVVGAQDAADLVHQAFIRAFERLEQLRDPNLFEAWVVRIALNEAKGLLRKRRRSVDIADAGAAVAPPGPDIGLRLIIEGLPQRERAVILLHYAYGYRMGEIARLLDLSEVNVRVLAFRARRRLKAQMKEATR